MTALTWDAVGERVYETGVDHGVLYLPDEAGAYDTGFAWNGLVTVTESPTGAESTITYADNIPYLNLISVEKFEATVEAYTYPSEFAACEGYAQPETGVMIGQQTRTQFGMSYRSKVGNDLDPEAGYKLHLVWNASAAPSEKAYNTVNETPEAITFSWALTTIPMSVEGYKPTASMTIDSTLVDPTALATLEALLYGGESEDPELPTPAAVLAIFAGSTTEATPLAPSYIPETETVVIPTVTGVVYKIAGVVVTGNQVITGPVLVKATPAAGYKFPAVIGTQWYFNTTTLVTPTAPTYDSGTDLVTVTATTGVIYKLNGTVVGAGTHPIVANATVTAHPAAGYAFPTTAVDVWFFTFA